MRATSGERRPFHAVGRLVRVWNALQVLRVSLSRPGTERTGARTVSSRPARFRPTPADGPRANEPLFALGASGRRFDAPMRSRILRKPPDRRGQGASAAGSGTAPPAGGLAPPGAERGDGDQLVDLLSRERSTAGCRGSLQGYASLVCQALGHNGQLAAELEQSCAANPLHGDLTYRRILALCGTGHQTDTQAADGH